MCSTIDMASFGERQFSGQNHPDALSTIVDSSKSANICNFIIEVHVPWILMHYKEIMRMCRIFLNSDNIPHWLP